MTGLVVYPAAGGGGSSSAAIAAAQAAAIAAAEAWAAQGLKRTAVKSGAYTLAPGDIVPVDASGGTVPLTLPSAPADGARCAFKIILQAATPNPVTLAVSGADVFNKAAGSTLLSYAAINTAVTAQYDAGTKVWTVTSTDSPLGVASGAAKLGTDGTVGGSGGSAIAAGAAVASFQTRTGAVTLSKADVTGTGLAASDVGADASGAAATEQTRALAAEALLAPKASPALTGSPTAPTQTAGDNSTKLATTAYADTLAATKVTKGGAEVFCATATGTAATDDTNLRAAITATASGGTLWIDGHYKIQTSALTLATAITIKGRQKVTYTGLGALPSGPNALTQVQGTIIEQTTAAVDCLAVTMSGQAFHMEDVVPAFTSGLASTGHGINCAPASNVVGVYGGSLRGVLCFGHDGNHYGLVRTNSLEFTTVDYRWWGGGGILDVATAGTINYGNTVDIHPYGTLTASGSAHGFAKSSAAGTTGPAGGGGSLNLMTFVRPQCNVAGAAGAGGTQKAWSDTVGAAYPWAVNIIGADFEASGFTNIIDFGPGTRLVGDQYFSTQFDSLNTAVGYKALGTAGLNAGTQHKSVAVGYNALAAQSTSVQNTAVGYFAGNAITTGTGLNTLVGYQAGKLITTGTTNTAVGGNALAANLTGGSCTAVGKDALLANTASSNTAVGTQTLNGVTSGSQHVAVGTGAGQTNPVGANYGTFVGYTAGTSGDNSGVTAIGNSAKGNAANTVALGKGAVASSAGGVAIGIDSTGATVTAANADTIALGTTKHVVLLAGAATASAPTYQKGAMYFDTTLNKLRIGGATAWETVTSS